MWAQDDASHLFDFVQAVFVAVWQVESGQFVSQFLLWFSDLVKGRLEFDMTGTLEKHNNRMHEFNILLNANVFFFYNSTKIILKIFIFSNMGFNK